MAVVVVVVMRVMYYSIGGRDGWMGKRGRGWGGGEKGERITSIHLASFFFVFFSTEPSPSPLLLLLLLIVLFVFFSYYYYYYYYSSIVSQTRTRRAIQSSHNAAR